MVQERPHGLRLHPPGGAADLRRPPADARAAAARRRRTPRRSTTCSATAATAWSPSEDVTALCPQRWCPGAPVEQPGHAEGARPAGGRSGSAAGSGGSGAGGRPAFYVKHTLLPHVPYLYLPSGRRTRNGVRDPIPGMNGEEGFGDSFLTRHNEQRFLLQLGFVDRQLGALIRRLRRARPVRPRPDRGDRGPRGLVRDRGTSSRRKVTLGNVDEVGPVPLFVKRAGPEARADQPGAGAHARRDADDRRRGERPDPLRRGRAVGVRPRGARPALRAHADAGLLAARSRSRDGQWEKRRRAVVRRRLRRYGSGEPRLPLHRDRPPPRPDRRRPGRAEAGAGGDASGRSSCPAGACAGCGRARASCPLSSPGTIRGGRRRSAAQPRRGGEREGRGGGAHVAAARAAAGAVRAEPARGCATSRPATVSC